MPDEAYLPVFAKRVASKVQKTETSAGHEKPKVARVTDSQAETESIQYHCQPD